MDSIEILIGIRKIVRSINLESKRIQKDFGISIPQLLCLGHLHNATKKRATHRELMKLLSLNSSTVTGIVNRLESKGYVRRNESREDKRVTLINLTAKGERVVQKAPRALHDELSAKIDQLPDKTKKMIRDSIDLIVDAMNIDHMEASPLLTISDPIEGNGKVGA
ncbi:MAG: MarR family winged helix-turn-helix transcriptional regulator [Cyclobacteriaceae bacterium]